MDQCEYATDVVFKRQADPAAISGTLTGTAIHTVKRDNIAKFPGKKLSPQFEGNRYDIRIEGTRIKHTMGPVSLKLQELVMIRQLAYGRVAQSAFCLLPAESECRGTKGCCSFRRLTPSGLIRLAWQTMGKKTAIIIGAGPAGATAYEFQKQSGVHPVILEKSATIGGISRTVSYKGTRIDVGRKLIGRETKPGVPDGAAPVAQGAAAFVSRKSG